MSQIRKHNVDFHISEKGYHNQNPLEGVIRELRRKWYRVMVRKQVPVKLYDYGFQWVSEIQSLTYTEAGGINTTPICEVTGETPDISEYLGDVVGAKNQKILTVLIKHLKDPDEVKKYFDFIDEPVKTMLLKEIERDSRKLKEFRGHLGGI